MLIDSLISAPVNDIFSSFIDPTLEKEQLKQNEQLHEIVQNIFDKNMEISQIQEKKEELKKENEDMKQAIERKRLEEDQAHQVDLDKIAEGEAQIQVILTTYQEKDQEDKEIRQAQEKTNEEQSQILEELDKQVVDFSQTLETDISKLKEYKEQKADLRPKLDDLIEIEKDKIQELEKKNRQTFLFVYLQQPLNYCLAKIQQGRENIIKEMQFCIDWIAQWSLSDYVWSKLEAVAFHPMTLIVLAILACVNPIAGAALGALVVYMLIKKVYALAKMYFPAAMQKLQII